MKITPEIKKELAQWLETFWKTYLKGDLDHWSTFLKEEYYNIGGTKEEIWHNRQEILDYSYSILDQIVGQVEIRNRKIDVIPYGDFLMVNEFTDLYVKIDKKWIFYGPFRMSTLLEKTDEGWIALHQHGSYPDMKATEGEAFAADALRAENEKLQFVVEEKTADLLVKNRELEIEASLERVRARTMAMQHSDELSEAAAELFKQIQLLGIEPWSCGFNIFSENYETITQWLSNKDGHPIPPFVTSATKDVFVQFTDAAKRGESLYVAKIDGQELVTSYEYLSSLPVVGEAIQESKASGIKLPTSQIFNLAYFKQGYLMFITYDAVDDFHPVFKRFAPVFEQTYTRFLDLQKAEAQAKESQIEAALEKVRSRSLAMHKSDELNEVVSILFEKLKELQIPATAVGIGVYLDGSRDMKGFVCGENKEGLVLINYHLPYFDNIISRDTFNAFEKQLDFFVGHYSKEEKNAFYTLIIENTAEFKKLPDDIKRMIFESPSYTVTTVSVKNAVFSINDFEGKVLGKKDIDIIKRFAKVFDQSYTRFLDLQKAEAQAKESQIEVALERIRSKALSMHSSDDLAQVIRTFYDEFVGLSTVEVVGLGAGLLNKENYIADIFTISKIEKGDLQEVRDKVDMQVHPMLKAAYEHWLKQEEYHHILRGNEIKDYYRALNSLVSIPSYSKEAVQYIYFPMYTEGSFYVVTEEELTQVELQIYRRFSSTLSLTYKRYTDLIDAEERAFLAVKEASLDRVRGEIASMRTATDLERITPLIWRELSHMRVPFFRCGLFIIKEEEKMVHAYLSKSDGTSVAAIHLPFDDHDNKLIQPMIQNWRSQLPYSEVWNQEQFIQQASNFVKKGQIEDSSTYKIAETPPERLFLHLVPFRQGMLYVGNHEELTSEQVKTVDSLSHSFGEAYARYEDFKALEEAKARVEHALGELKATQAQLVQQEKLASLGQLTAGIAHEIKNPLNFVNNFSDLSRELIEEVFEELKGLESSTVKEEIIAILQDVQSNLVKVHEHGSRADSIVTSMLQHSRASGSKREPQAFNLLVKEFVNLSFHGMRAGKAPINVDIDLQLDSEVGDVSLISEDFSRVILNLCNNAFDAMREKGKNKAEKEEKYRPKLTVRTRLDRKFIYLEIEDNGLGIPDEIKDKILQPFFTTKKGTEGTGLGLSITNDIIKSHGGELKVESKEGQSSEFCIQLPLKIS